MYTLSNFYKNKKWQDLLEIFKLKHVDYNGDLIYEHCYKSITKAYDYIGHYIEEITESNVNDYNISLNKNSIKLIHFKCNSIIY